MATIYIALAGQDFRLASAEIIKETPQGYRIDRNAVTKIHGEFWYLPDRLDKTSRHYSLFLSLQEAQAWCLSEMRRTEQHLVNELARTQSNIVALEDAMKGNSND